MLNTKKILKLIELIFRTIFVSCTSLLKHSFLSFHPFRFRMSSKKVSRLNCRRNVKRTINFNSLYSVPTIYHFKPFKLTKIIYSNSRMPSPLARSGHRVVASESSLFVLGGYNPQTHTNTDADQQYCLFQELWSYNFARNDWQCVLSDNENMPRELASNALIMHKNALISYGGTAYPFGQSCSNDCYIFRTKSLQVEKLETGGKMPLALYGPAIVVHDNYLYTIGGTTGHDYYCDVYRLNLDLKIWELVCISRPDINDDPEGRYRHEVAYDGHYIYVLGGGTSTKAFDLVTIPAFNLKTNVWENFETNPDPLSPIGFPEPRKCFSCVQCDTSDGVEVFITGGFQGDFEVYYNDIWKLNLRQKRWTLLKKAKLPLPLYFHSAANPGNGCMYIFGGVEYRRGVGNRQNKLFKMWIKIPKLSEMCWEAITFYNPDLRTHSKSDLLKNGIPERFVCRVLPTN